jgi:hypothetical protein
MVGHITHKNLNIWIHRDITGKKFWDGVDINFVLLNLFKTIFIETVYILSISALNVIS